MSVSHIRDSDIISATRMFILDDAIGYLQTIAGIDDGGVAAIAFSGLYNPDEWWANASLRDRENKIRDYIKLERAYES